MRGTRIGLFGGTFNPVHVAHLRAAEEIRRRCRLDEIRFVLAAVPPHKAPAELAPVTDRLRMLELAVGRFPALSVSTIEIDRGGVSYSIDTIRQVLRGPRAPSKLFLIVGLEVFREMDTWRSYAEIFTHCNVAVISRPGTMGPLKADDFPVACRDQFCYDSDCDYYRHESGNTVTYCAVNPLPISATEIRDQVSAGRSIESLVPIPVEHYIRDHRLYRITRSPHTERS